MLRLVGGGVRGERRREGRLGERGGRRIGETARMVGGRRERRGGRRRMFGVVRGGAGGGKEVGMEHGEMDKCMFYLRIMSSGVERARNTPM